jgi:nitrate reductase NapE component
MVTTPLLSDRQEDLILFLPMAEQMFPIVQSENLVMVLLAYGFMMYFASASQVDEVRGQHCDESSSFWPQVCSLQS